VRAACRALATVLLVSGSAGLAFRSDPAVAAGSGLASVVALVGTAADTSAGTSAGTSVGSDWIARVGDEPIPRRPVEALLVLARREQPALTLPELTRLLAVDLLMGDAAAREVGDATLFASRRVAFAPEVDLRRQWLATLQQVWPERIERAWRVAAPELPVTVDTRAWQALWAERRGDGLRMDDDLDEARRAEAARLVLLKFRGLKGAPGAVKDRASAGVVTVADIWPLQNVQGRRMLRAGDLDFARAQARQLLRERFVEQWLHRESGWTPFELHFVRRVVEARQRTLAWARWQGLTGDPHGDAPPRDALAAAVSADEIARYYQAHLDRFARLESVEGLRLRCDPAGCGQEAQRADLRGRPGVTAIAWRIGDPKPASEVDAWVLDLLQAWPAGVASPPIRHPDGAGWERVQSLAVTRGHHPLDSETVRHEARQAVALEKLEACWRLRQVGLLAAAGLRWAPGIEPPRGPFEPGRPIPGGEGHGHAH